MSDGLWFENFGLAIPADQLTATAAKQLVTVLSSGMAPGARLLGTKESANMGCSAVHLEVDVERPQDLAHPIRATEPIVVLFPLEDGQPSVLALRHDFPETHHQNFTPAGAPCSLCVDDRPWNEARLTSTAPDLIRRIQLWLAKAARGELHDPAQPADPLFYKSTFDLVIPPEALTQGNVQLSGFRRRDNDRLIITHLANGSGDMQPAFVVLTFQAQPQRMSRLRHAPATLADLAIELENCGIALLDDLRGILKGWAGASPENIRRLTARLVFVVAFPVLTGGDRTASDLRGFVSLDTAGDVGVALGVLNKNESDIGSPNAYMPTIGMRPAADLTGIHIEPVQAHFSFNRELAASVAGHPAPDRRRAVLVGAGSLGSQLALNLAREGSFIWTVVDNDHLLPHNLARHGLLSRDMGAPKSSALANQLGGLLGETFTSITADILRPSAGGQDALTGAFAEADIIIDSSASVGVSRHLADLEGSSARRVSVFFNPAGTSVVLLVESADRSITLRDLEAQYHRTVLSEPMLADHLQTGQSGVRYSGSCRSVTNRIPATRASLLSAIASRGIAAALSQSDASLKIWTTHPDGQVGVIERSGEPAHRAEMGGWKISYDEGLLRSLAALREARLPSETGGVLLGIADMHARSIHIAYAMPQPPDSRGTQTAFERGVVGVTGAVAAAVEATMHQVRYIGEWHSHPRRSSVLPSSTDVAQLMWLGDELKAEGLPALMAIAGDDGKYAFLIKRDEEPVQPVRLVAGAQ